MKTFILLFLVKNIFAYESVQIDMHGGSYENTSFMGQKNNFSNQRLSSSSFRDNNTSINAHLKKSKKQL